MKVFFFENLTLPTIHPDFRPDPPRFVARIFLFIPGVPIVYSRMFIFTKNSSNVNSRHVCCAESAGAECRLQVYIFSISVCSNVLDNIELWHDNEFSSSWCESKGVTKPAGLPLQLCKAHHAQIHLNNRYDNTSETDEALQAISGWIGWIGWSPGGVSGEVQSTLL